MSQQDVDFKTIDGLTLRGRMYIASNRGPGIVMSPGVSATSPRLTFLANFE